MRIVIAIVFVIICGTAFAEYSGPATNIQASQLAPGAAAANLTTLPACTPGSNVAPVATGQFFTCSGVILQAQ